MGLSGRRYFSVTRPVLVSVTGAQNGAAHGSTIAVTAQLTALTNSARFSETRQPGTFIMGSNHKQPCIMTAFCFLLIFPWMPVADFHFSCLLVHVESLRLSNK